MDRPRLSAFPRRAWLTCDEHVRPDATVATVCRLQRAFFVGYMARGHAAVRWVHRGRERRFDVGPGAVRVSPADGEWHTLVASHRPGNSYCVLIIPRSQMDELAGPEGGAGPVEWHHRLWPDDAVLRRCMADLSAPVLPEETATDGRQEEAAWRLVLRLLEAEGRTPSWRCDGSVFVSRVLDDLVAYIDDHLASGVGLFEMGPLVGLTPSHFARKFRRTVGLSLHRFVVYRRVQASFSPLRAGEIPLARLAIDLGFSSQSHFTRLFGELTGMTPAKYRRQFHRHWVAA